MTIHRLIVYLSAIDHSDHIDIEISTFDNATIEEVLINAYGQNYFIVDNVLFKNTAYKIVYLEAVPKEPTLWIGDEEEE